MPPVEVNSGKQIVENSLSMRRANRGRLSSLNRLLHQGVIQLRHPSTEITSPPGSKALIIPDQPNLEGTCFHKAVATAGGIVYLLLRHTAFIPEDTQRDNFFL